MLRVVIRCRTDRINVALSLLNNTVESAELYQIPILTPKRLAIQTLVMDTSSEIHLNLKRQVI